MTKRSSRITAMLLVFAVIISMAFTFEDVSAASKKPVKVKGIKISKIKKTKGTATLTWKKAKRAKKYEIYHKNVSDKIRWVKLKTVKKNSARIKEEYINEYGTTYLYKVRGVNGKKKGKFSKTVKVTFKPAEKSTINLIKEGEIQDITPEMMTNPEYETPELKNINVSMSQEINEGVIIMKGMTEDGLPIKMTCASSPENIREPNIRIQIGYVGGIRKLEPLNNEDWYNESKISRADWYFDSGITTEFKDRMGLGQYAYKAYSPSDDIKLYWTVDGTEPQIGQEDLVGQPVQLEDGHHVKLRGTVLHSDGVTPMGNIPAAVAKYRKKNGNDKFMVWIKAYKNDKYIGECFEYTRAWI